MNSSSLIRYTRVMQGVALASIVGLLVWSVSYLRTYRPLADLMSGPSGLDSIGLQVQDASVVGRVDGKRRWRVSAQLISFSKDLRQATVTGLHNGLLLSVKQLPLAALQAGSAVYESTMPILGTSPQGTLFINGGIRAKLLRPYGPTVQASGLSWKPSANLLQSTGTVSAVFPAHAGTLTGGARLRADGVVWNASTDQLGSSGSVKVVFDNNAGVAMGTSVSVDMHSGNLSLRALTGTFTLPAPVKNKMFSKAHLPIAAAIAITMVTAPAPAAPAHNVSYQAGASLWLNAQHQAQLSDGVTIKQDDATLQTQAAVVNFDDQQHATFASSAAPVHLWDTQSDLTGSRGTIDFTTHLATVKGSVVLLVRPGADNETAAKTSLLRRFKSPATLTCDLMTYNYQSKQGTVPGALTVHQAGRTLTADSGLYDGRTQIVTLIGHVHGYDGSNDIHAPQAFVGVRQGEEFIRIDNKVSGVFKPGADNDGSASTNDGSTSDSNTPVDDPDGYQKIMDGGPTAPAASGAGDSGTITASPAAPAAPASTPTPAPSGSPSSGPVGKSSPSVPVQAASP